MKNNNYRLFLFKPSAINYTVDWNSSDYREQLLGELKVDNLSVNIKLQDISTINFDLPENIFGELNPRLDEVLDNYIVELWYGDLSNPTTHRFIIVKSPLEYDDGIKKYCYEGNSIEHQLEFRRLSSWEGVKVKDFYRTIRYDYSTNRFTETASTGNPTPTYNINVSTYEPSGEEEPVQYITIPTTTAATQPPSTFDIFIYQYRRNNTDTLNSETSLIEYLTNVPSGTLYENTSGFKPGFYIPVVDANSKVTSIHIALPKDFKQFNSETKVFEIFLYDNPISRHFAVGVNSDEEIEASDMYLDLAQDSPVKFTLTADAVQNSNVIQTVNSSYNRFRLVAGQTITGTGIASGTKISSLQVIRSRLSITLTANYTGATTNNRRFTVESLNAAEYGAYAFTPQLVYSKNGLKLEHILNGNVENSTITEDGILYDTDFTIGTIHADIAAKYRSNIELNNITKYEAIKTLAESFDAIVVFNSVNKTVSFYPDKNEDVFTNNGLIITKENYLKSITNDIDSSKIITKAYGTGKDNIDLSLITPNGSSAWEDYSYYLDSYYVEYPSEETTQAAKEAAISSSGVVIANDSLNDINNNTGVNFTSFPTGSLARWIDSTEALKIAKWQYARDYFHDIMLGEFNPLVSEHDRYFDLYNLRSEAINNFVKEESKYFELKANEYKYKYLYEFYVKSNDNAASNTRQKTYTYKFSSNTTVADPGSTFFRLNSNVFSNVTQIVIDDFDNSFIDRRLFLTSITANNNPRIVLADQADVLNGSPTNYVFYQINSITSNTGYVVLNVTYQTRTIGLGTTFQNNNTINLYFETWEEIYKSKYDEAIAASAYALSELDKLHFNLYNTRFDGSQVESTDADFTALVTNIQPNSFATKIKEVQGFLTKSRWSIDEEKLQPFVKEAIMSDSNLDNELDLLTTTREYLVETSKPIVTLSVSVVDFLASAQSSNDWNKVKIGEIVNIYFPDFNIDTTAQLKEISIDFQSNSLSFTISTYRQYSRPALTYVMRQIRNLYDNSQNRFKYKYDKNNIGSGRANLVNRKLTKAGFAAEQAPIKLGAKRPDGSSSTEISGEGIVSTVIGVDPILETFDITTNQNEKTLQIADGTLTARNVVKDGSNILYTTEVEVSGDNGLVIRKVDTDGIATPQVYIDTNGNAVFSGFVSINQDEVGYNEEGVFIGEDNQVSKFSLISGNTSMIFDPDAADYKLIINGEAKIGPLTIGNVGNTFAILDTTNSITVTSTQSNPYSTNKTYNFGSIDNFSTVYGVDISSDQFSQGGSLTSRKIQIDLYKVETGGTTLVYSSEEQTLPNSSFYFSSNDNTFIIPAISANRIVVNIFSNTSLSSGTIWTISRPNVSIANSKIAMGLFSVDSAGELFTKEITIGTGTNITTIENGSLTAPRTILTPNQSGTILLNTTNPGPALNIYSTDHIVISNQSYLNKDITISANDKLILTSATNDIELTAADNIVLQSTANDVELNAADHIDLVATNGTFVYGDLTVNNNLIVKGSTITVDSTTLTVNDKNIEIGSVDNSARPFTVISGSDQITSGNTLGIFEGQTITGSGIPSGTTVESVVNSSTIRMSANATSTGTPATLTFGRKFNTTNSSTSINTGNTRGLIVGQSITGTGIPANTRISSITNETTLVMTNAATSTNTQTSLVFGSATDFTADGGGITLKGASDKTIIWYDDNNAWEFNQGIEVVGNVISLDAGQSLKLSGISDPTHRLFHDASTDYDVIEYSTGFQLRHYSTGNQLTLTGSNGRVGIGTTTPAELLDVNGNITHQGLVMTTGTNVDQTKQTTFTSALTTAWTDVTGVSGTYLTTGSYIVQIESNGEYYTGQMSWFSGSTTSAIADEIQLHRAGPTASAARIYARVIRVSAGTLKLQVAASTSVGSHTMTFKFRRTI